MATNRRRKHDRALNTVHYTTYSVRGGAAPAVYLKSTSVGDIMLQGRWSSDALTIYIKREVLQRSAGISATMLKTDKFFLLPRRVNPAPLHQTKTSITYRSSREGAFTTSPNLHLAH